MWALHAIRQLPSSELVTALADQDEYVRAWAIQLLCEDMAPPSEALQKFAELAKNDPSPVVRLYLASASQRVSDAAKWQVLEGLVQHAEDASDHNLPKMEWFALEPLVVGEPARSLALAESSKIPMLTRHIARRLGSAEKIEELLTKVKTTKGDVQWNLLLGLRDALEGRFDMKSPKGWTEVYSKLRADGGEAAKIALQLSQQFGDSAAAQTMLQTLQDKQAKIEDRRQALQGLVGRKRPEVQSQLIGLLEEQELRREAIRGMGAFDDVSFAKELLRRYPKLSAEEKQEAIHLLASRSKYGVELTAAIRKGDVPKSDIPAYVARLLRRVVGNSFVDVWGPIDELGTDKEAMLAKYRELLKDEPLSKADLAKGRALFNRTCAACHKLHGYGGEVGPDITGANRTNLEYLLSNIVTPSAIIQDAYKMHIVLMEDGRILSGIPPKKTKGNSSYGSLTETNRSRYRRRKSNREKSLPCR